MATLRHLPVLLDIVQEIQESAPQAWLHIINNPMPRLVMGVLRGTGHSRVVGHCHGTMAVVRFLSKLTDTPVEYIDVFVAGINHFHLVQKATDTRTGRDLIQVLRTLTDPNKVSIWQKEEYTQWRMFQELDQLIGHGMWHNYDYLPYANHRMFRHSDTNTWPRANVAVLAKREQAPDVGKGFQSLASTREFLEVPEEEQVFRVIQALSGEAGPYRYLSGNSTNGNKLPGLPAEAIVELPSVVTSSGIELDTPAEPLPSYFESWLRTQITIHELSVDAVLSRSRRSALEAIVCDPVFRECDCGPSELLDDLLAANFGLVPRLS